MLQTKLYALSIIIISNKIQDRIILRLKKMIEQNFVLCFEVRLINVYFNLLCPSLWPIPCSLNSKNYVHKHRVVCLPMFFGFFNKFLWCMEHLFNITLDTSIDLPNGGWNWSKYRNAFLLLTIRVTKLIMQLDLRIEPGLWVSSSITTSVKSLKMAINMGNEKKKRFSKDLSTQKEVLASDWYAKGSLSN